MSDEIPIKKAKMKENSNSPSNVKMSDEKLQEEVQKLIERAFS